MLSTFYRYFANWIALWFNLVVVGKCRYVRLQHASADALAATDHGNICNSRHNHVL